MAWGVLVMGLLVIIVQDIQTRAISWWTIPWVLLTSVYLALQYPFWEWCWLLVNVLFIGVQWLGVSLYFSLKHRRWINITQNYLGVGDGLFFLAITPLFSPLQFCCFFISALLTTLIGVGFYRMTSAPVKTIPLAGAMSLVGLLYYPLLWSQNIAPYDDWILLEFWYG